MTTSRRAFLGTGVRLLATAAVLPAPLLVRRRRFIYRLFTSRPTAFS
jgi:hypothetical protein